ncbi:cysteine peptidase family C39 domain-containing protein [Ectobacillus funiculus]
MEDTKSASRNPVRITRRSKVPFIEQMEQSECGLCCLAMIFSYYKSEVPLSELRDRGGGAGTERTCALSGILHNP